MTSDRDDDTVALPLAEPGPTEVLPAVDAPVERAVEPAPTEVLPAVDAPVERAVEPAPREVLAAVDPAPTPREVAAVATAPQVMSLSGDTTATAVLAPVDRDPTPVAGVRLVRRRPSWRRRVTLVVLGLFLATFVYVAITLYQVHSTGRSDQARPVHALVVMGAAQYDGRPSPQLQARLDHALGLWNDGLADVVVVTGGKQPADRFTEAEASAEYLSDRGVPIEQILLENGSHNSYDALLGVAGIVPQGASVLIVTDPYHSLRSRLIAEEVGLKAYVSPTRTSPVQGSSAQAREVKEALGIAVGRIIGFRRLTGLTG